MPDLMLREKPCHAGLDSEGNRAAKPALAVFNVVMPGLTRHPWRRVTRAYVAKPFAGSAIGRLASFRPSLLATVDAGSSPA
jgi:hypothetical protein